MKNLFCILAFVLLCETAVAQFSSDEIALYNSAGEPVAYIADTDSTIYLWSGKPVAYLHSDEVYSFDGKHLGWFVKGLIYNHEGEVVAAIRSRLKNVPQIAPIKSIKEIKPIKGIREISPVKPILLLAWSRNQALLSFFLVGDEGRSPEGGNCETGHWIESVTDDGKIIKLENGSMWKVDDVDVVTTSLWLPVSKILVCGTKMINVDEKESAEVQPVHLASTRSRTASAGRGYIVEAAENDETFVINGQIFKAKTYCFGLDKGDRVSFAEGSPFGACVSAKVLNLRNNKICEVWCE